MILKSVLLYIHPVRCFILKYQTPSYASITLLLSTPLVMDTYIASNCLLSWCCKWTSLYISMCGLLYRFPGVYMQELEFWVLGYTSA